jgi:hypothetical protein
MKTRQEIEALKANWIGDPCWDIEDTQGYEEYRTELLAYRLRVEDALRAGEDERINKRAEQLGCSRELIRCIEMLEYKIDRLTADK